MKKALIILCTVLLCGLHGVRAQQIDSTLLGQTVHTALPPGVMVNDTRSVRAGYRAYMKEAGQRRFQGYRIRIFFDNSRSARKESEAAEQRFRELHPDIPTYRTFSNLYYKVTVGDYTSKSSALKELNRYKREFPSAFLVKEQIQFGI